MSCKNFILDTSVIIHDPNCFEVFKDNKVIIPITVLEELDKIKTRPDFGGANARTAIRKLNDYFKLANPSNGIKIPNNVDLFIDVGNTSDDRFKSDSNKDDKILACAAFYVSRGAVLVSKDIAMRLRAQSFNIIAQDYTNDKIQNANDVYLGYRDINLDDCTFSDFSWNGLASCIGTPFEDLYPNECVQVTSNGKKSILRKNAEGKLCPISIPEKIWGIGSKNREQAFAIDLLLDSTVQLVSLIGKAGCGKTLIGMAAALECVLTNNCYSKMEIYRPIVPVGNDLGYLPGSLEEKLSPWMAPIHNALEFLIPANSNIDSFIHATKNRINMEAISYIRGKSANKTYILLDETQNLSRSEIKTIITRVGFDSKIVLTGDIEQIDNSYLDATNNGLTYVAEAFKHSKLAGHVLLTKGERSGLATEASLIL